MPKKASKSKSNSKSKNDDDNVDVEEDEGLQIQIGYMHHKVIKSLYKELKKNSLENAVDAMWANILPLYFSLLDGYAILPQPYPLPGVTKTKPDFAIRYIDNGQPRKVCLIEDKRVQYESSDAEWFDAVVQLTNYMLTARVANPDPTETMYGIVTVGHYSRFYELVANAQLLQDLSGSDGSPLHFKHNELEIDTILCSIVELTKS